jgi:hypothetical protein
MRYVVIVLAVAACGGGGGAASKLCQPCSSQSECDPGGLCITKSAGTPTYCGIDCTSSACPTGYGCVMVSDGTGAVVGMQCAPNGSCIAMNGPDAAPASNDDLQFCVDQTNMYRAMVMKPALSRSSALDAYAAQGAMIDGTAHVAHKHFTDTSGGGISFAENEIPWWSMAQNGSIHDIIAAGLQLMWNEGPGGGHYDNMTGAYTQLGCGIFVNGDEVTVTQDYAP